MQAVKEQITCLLSRLVLARQPKSKVKSVDNISRNILGVFGTTTFHTCRAACLTVRDTSERPIYKPAKTLLRRSYPR